MARYLLSRAGSVFTGQRIEDGKGKLVFSVKGSYAAKAAIRLFGIVTPIQDYFFDNPHGSHSYNVCDDPNDPYLGRKSL